MLLAENREFRKIVKEMAGKSASFGGERVSFVGSVQVPARACKFRGKCASLVRACKFRGKCASPARACKFHGKCASLVRGCEFRGKCATPRQRVQLSFIYAASKHSNLDNSDSRPGGLLLKAAVER